MQQIKRIVFVVDDDPSIRDSIMVFIQCLNLDLTVKLFPSAMQFFDYVVSQKNIGSCCLIIDEIMPGLNGSELIQKLIDFDIKTPTILMTGHANQQFLNKIEQLDLKAFLEKPFEPTLLQKTLTNVFGVS